MSLQRAQPGAPVKTERLRVLLVEDSDDDAFMVLRELSRAEAEVEHRRVQTIEELTAALDEPWDIVLSDYALPTLEAPRVLATVRSVRPDLPLIVVSGTIGEETAVEVMRGGANDYILKHNLRRLVPAVLREVREGRERAARRRLEEAQRRSEASFRLIVERSPDLVVVHREGGIVYANPTTLERLGHSAEALVGRPLATVVNARRPGVGASTNAPIFEQLWRRADGTALPVEVVSSEVSFDGSSAVLLLARDLTERDRIAAGMIEMDRMAAIGILAAGVGHEINNPLAYVLANLEYVTSELELIVGALVPAARERLDAQIVDLRQALTDTMYGAHRVREIVSDLRTFSRSEGEKLGPVDVRQVLDASLRMAAVQIRQRATVHKRYADVSPILANEGRLGQVFLNLVVNAAQALPEGRPTENAIVVEVREEGDEVVVVVSDTGNGIPSDVAARIFEPFFTTKGPGQGTGLGLSICKRIISSLGGEIRVTSALGEGATFTVTLPKASSSVERPKTNMPQRLSGSHARARILCVDDDEALGSAIRRVLAEEYEVVVFTSAGAARDLVAAGEHFDVVLCDVMMPGMSGVDLYEEIAVLAPELTHRVVFVTGGVFTDRVRQFLDEVPNPRLEKPVGVDELRAVIAELLVLRPPRSVTPRA